VVDKEQHNNRRLRTRPSIPCKNWLVYPIMGGL
jgi:hypothetical protein